MKKNLQNESSQSQERRQDGESNKVRQGQKEFPASKDSANSSGSEKEAKSSSESHNKSRTSKSQ